MDEALKKRPLCFFGAAYFLVSLAAVWLPAGAVLPLAALSTAALALFLLFGRRLPLRGGAFSARLLLAAAGAALWLCLLHHAVTVAPLQKLAGSTCRVTAQVLDTAPGPAEESMEVTLRVTRVEGEAGLRPFDVKIYGFGEWQIGDILQTELSFYALPARAAGGYYARGYYIGARAAGEVTLLGNHPDFWCLLRIWRQAAGNNILARLPVRLGGTAAAMVVGDTRYLSEQVKDLYRAAGLSHLLVVSGSHFSLLCGGVAALLHTAVGKRKAASVLCMAFAVAFALLFGLSPSVLRSGLACLLVFGGKLVNRKADIYTSLGFAALVLAVLNPYAAVDLGAWLSFAATLGVLLGSYVNKKYACPLPLARGPRLRKMRRWLWAAFCASLFASLCTLPVLALGGLGVSLLSVVLNIPALVLSVPILPLGLLLAALPPGLPFIEMLLRPIAFTEALLLRGMEWLAGAGGLPGSTLYVRDITALALLVAPLLVLLGLRLGKLRAFALSACAVFCVSLALQFAFCYNMVSITVAGRGLNTSLVVTQNGRAAVLYRSARSLDDIRETLRFAGADECVLLLDLRRSAQGTEAEAALQPAQSVAVQREVFYREAYTPFPGVTVYVLRQANGIFACVEAGGVRAGIYTGSVDLRGYPVVDMLVAGSGQAQGNFARIVITDTLPAWAAGAENIWYSTGRAAVWLRPNSQAKPRYKEMRYAPLD